MLTKLVGSKRPTASYEIYVKIIKTPNNTTGGHDEPEAQDMIILGIDPGIAIVGYGVVEYKAPRFTTLDYGAITTPAHTSVDSRLEIIYSSLTKLIEMYRPSQLSVEKLFFNTNTKTAIDVAQARGVILLAARQNGLDIGEYTPLQVKQAVTGYGQADKRQVMLMIKTLLSLETIPKPDDAADALAVAVCHAHSVRM